MTSVPVEPVAVPVPVVTPDDDEEVLAVVAVSAAEVVCVLPVVVSEYMIRVTRLTEPSSDFSYMSSPMFLVNNPEKITVMEKYMIIFKTAAKKVHKKTLPESLTFSFFGFTGSLDVSAIKINILSYKITLRMQGLFVLYTVLYNNTFQTMYQTVLLFWLDGVYLVFIAAFQVENSYSNNAEDSENNDTDL